MNGGSERVRVAMEKKESSRLNFNLDNVWLHFYDDLLHIVIFYPPFRWQANYEFSCDSLIVKVIYGNLKNKQHV